ncbi:MAG: carbon storage regulator [Gammaproteobacteria bacterium]|nr:carbon storage regulator [Gammaproteobacteria bacterium]
MLTLTIKDNETLHIGDDIKIVIKRANGATSKVSIEAPKAVKILRDKLVR